MKLIRFDTPCPDTQPVPDSFFTDNAVILADSSWRPHRRPLFFPNEGSWLCEIRLAVKISRLGKAIEEKFAPRYYDELCLVNFLIRKPDPELFTTPDCMIDDALIHGEWFPLHNGIMEIEVKGTKGASDNTVISNRLELPTAFINHALKSLSHESTFKTGDIIVLPQSPARFSPLCESHIEASINGLPALDFKIK